MKYQLSIMCLVWGLVSSCEAQPAKEKGMFSYPNFEQQVLAFTPEQRAGVTEKSYYYAEMILDEVKSATKGEPENFNVADYMNLLSAFLTLNEPQAHIDIAMKKLLDAEGHCKYLNAFERTMEENEKYAPVREKWRSALAACQDADAPIEAFDIEAYATDNGLDKALVALMRRIEIADQRYRLSQVEGNREKQRALDQENQQRIDSLYVAHGAYIGRSMVGQKYEAVMWAVIQHSDAAMMGRYLPVVHQAYLNKEIGQGPFKMLIDRYYGLTEGYQVFGTQSGFGFELADEVVKQSIVRRYNLD